MAMNTMHIAQNSLLNHRQSRRLIFFTKLP